MPDIHVETGTRGVTLDYPAAIETRFLQYLQAQGVEIGNTTTTLEHPEGVSSIRSAEVHRGVDILVSVVFSWCESQGINPRSTNDGAGNFHWEYDLL